jgi:hypothetical protein
MPGAHRNNDGRICGATTTVVGQSTVFANGELIAVDGDPNTHGGGGLIAANANVYIEGKLAVNHTPENSAPDSLCVPLGPPHCNPQTSEGSPDVIIAD